MLLTFKNGDIQEFITEIKLKEIVSQNGSWDDEIEWIVQRYSSLLSHFTEQNSTAPSEYLVGPHKIYHSTNFNQNFYSLSFQRTYIDKIQTMYRGAGKGGLQTTDMQPQDKQMAKETLLIANSLLLKPRNCKHATQLNSSYCMNSQRQLIRLRI